MILKEQGKEIELEVCAECSSLYEIKRVECPVCLFH